MSRIWFIVWAIVTFQVAAWAFAPKPVVQQIAAVDGPGYGSNEIHIVAGKKMQREDVTRAFEGPYGARCGDGRKQFLASVGAYYYRRQNELERYPETFGKPGAEYIAKQWSTGEDRRIERLTQEAYAQGYFVPTDFDAVARKLVEAVVGNERIVARSCAG